MVWWCEGAVEGEVGIIIFIKDCHAELVSAPPRQVGNIPCRLLIAWDAEIRHDALDGLLIYFEKTVMLNLFRDDALDGLLIYFKKIVMLNLFQHPTDSLRTYLAGYLARGMSKQVQHDALDRLLIYFKKDCHAELVSAPHGQVTNNALPVT
ncbi:hypothetical protein ACVW2L_002425 [Mucilaginibacter sp. HD30]